MSDKTPAKAKPAALPPGLVIGGYRLVRKIAAGGFGIVYLAEDAQGAQVAIKEYLPASLSSRAEGERVPVIETGKLSLYRLGLKSFFEEGRALAQVSHSSVVGVRNFFRENETVYMVMDYLEGATLQDYIVTAREANGRHKKVLRGSTIHSLFDEILHGLRVVHQHRMLHLDIKPANIFITDADRAVLIDFGAAREVVSQDFLRPMYTPGFAAPEMYRRNLPMGPWTDIYAIGACMYACMHGLPPPDAQQRQKKDDQLTQSLGRLRAAYHPRLVEIVQWCMALDADARPQSIFGLLKELNHPDGQSPNAPPLSALASRTHEAAVGAGA